MNDRQSSTPRIHIGHTLHAFEAGGMEQGVLNIVNFGDRDRFRHIIVCLTQAGAFASRLNSAACEVVELHKRAGNDLQLPGRIAAVARRQRLDILHARGWPTMVETAIAARLAGVRATIYGFHGKTMQELQGIRLRRRIVQKMMIRWYNRVLTLNRQMRSDIGTEYGLQEDRIQIIANGVDVEAFQPRNDRHALRVRFGLPADRFILGSVARLDPVKNLEVILRVLRRLQEQGCKPFFLVIGEGSHRDVLQREIQRLQVVEEVCLFGYSERIPELLNCMDLYIQPSFYEGFSNTVLEAMACGLPVLASGAGGTRDVLSEGQEGFFFEPADDDTLTALILRLYQDSFLRGAIGKRARRHVVEHFSVQMMVHNYESMYLELASVASRPRNSRLRE